MLLAASRSTVGRGQAEARRLKRFLPILPASPAGFAPAGFFRSSTAITAPMTIKIETIQELIDHEHTLTAVS